MLIYDKYFNLQTLYNNSQFFKQSTYLGILKINLSFYVNNLFNKKLSFLVLLNPETENGRDIQIEIRNETR